MRIRTLVPALACLAAAPIYAADSTPAVKVDGFVDTVLSGSSLIDSDPEDSRSNTAFGYQAKLGVSATISDKVSAQVDAFIDGDSISVTGDDSITIRQAYGIWKINSDISLKTGKFINDYGWVAVYAPDLFRVNSGPITGLYGAYVVGADVTWKKDALTVNVMLANGFFGESYNADAQSGSGQKDQAMALGFDVVYDLAGKGSVNAEFVYDMNANAPAAGGDGGDGMHLAVNGKFTPNEQVTAGAELIWQAIDPIDNAAADATENHLGLMAMVNYKLGSAMPIPASVTAMIQYIGETARNNVEDNDASELELSLALLTNPAGTDKLGANLEIYYDSTETDNGVTTTEATELGLAAELLYVF